MSNNFNSYTKEVLKRFTNPKNFGEIKNPDGVGVVGNPQCGDVMKIYLKVDKEKNKIKNIKFQTFGCVSAIASSDALCELAKGKTIEEAKKITNQEILDKLNGLPSIKIHCSVLGANGLKKAIEDYEKTFRKSFQSKTGKISKNFQSKTGKISKNFQSKTGKISKKSDEKDDEHKESNEECAISN